MPKEKLIITGNDIKISNRPDEERYGCDYCKEKKPTEMFNGYCGGRLWICGDCYKKLKEKN